MKNKLEALVQRIIQKPKAFFYVFYKSLAFPKYYKEILKTKTSFTTKYFLALTALAALTMAISTSITVIPQLQKTASEFISQIKDIYPDDLVISAQNNEWAINKEEPLIVTVPVLEEAQDDFPDNFIVFDHEGTVEDMDTYNTFALINSKNMLFKDAGGLSTYPLKDIPDGEIHKEGFVQMMDKLHSFISVLTYLFIVVGFIPIFLILALTWGFEILVLSGVLWAISIIMATKMKFLNAVRVSVHTMSLPVVITVLASLLRFEIPLVGWFFVLHLIIGIVVLGEFGKDKAKG